MSAETISKRPLTQLNQEIESVEADVARLEAERTGVARDASRAAGELRWLRLARLIRRPTASFDMWPTVALLVGSGMVGILVLIIVHLIFGSLALGFLGLLVGLAAGVYLFYSLLYRPSDAVLPAAIAEAESHSRLAQARLKEKVERIAETKARLQSL